MPCESTEDPQRATLTRRISSFRKAGDGAWRRDDETHRPRLFDPADVRDALGASGFIDIEALTTWDGADFPPGCAAFTALARA